MVVETLTTWISDHQLLVFSWILVILALWAVIVHFSEIIDFVESNRRD